MVQLPIGFLENQLLQVYYDDPKLTHRTLTNAIKLFELLQGKESQQIIGKFCFANAPISEPYLSKIQISLNPAADTGPCWTWAEAVYPQNDVLIAQIGGYILFHPDNNFQKVFLITGPGGNGKGTFLRILTAILEEKVLGEPLACSVDFDEFGKHERFEIIGKRLVYDPDISGNAKTQRWIKILSGGDRITASQKFKQPITFYPTCKLLLLSNPIPEWETNPALLRRIILLRFMRKFKVDPEVEFRLLTPAMLEQWVSFFWHGYQDFKRHGFRLIEENSAGEFLSQANDISSFFQDLCCFGDKYEIPAVVLYRHFVQYWKDTLQETRQPQNARVIGKRLKEIGVEKVRNVTLTSQQCKQYHLTDPNKRYDMYKGITVVE